MDNSVKDDSDNSDSDEDANDTQLKDGDGATVAIDNRRSRYGRPIKQNSRYADYEMNAYSRTNVVKTRSHNKRKVLASKEVVETKNEIKRNDYVVEYTGDLSVNGRETMEDDDDSSDFSSLNNDVRNEVFKTKNRNTRNDYIDVPSNDLDLVDFSDGGMETTKYNNDNSKEGIYIDDRFLNDIIDIDTGNGTLQEPVPNYTSVIENMSKSSGTDGSLFWLHVGISSDNTMIDKIMSAAIIADYIFRVVTKGSKSKLFINQLEHVVHPFSAMIDTNFNPLVADWDYLPKAKNLYNELRERMNTKIGVKFDAYRTYSKKVTMAKVIFHRFTSMCRKHRLVEGGPDAVFSFVKFKSPILFNMLEGRSKSFLSKQTEIITAITIENYRFHNGDTLAHQTPSHPGIQKPKSKPKPIVKKKLNFHQGRTHPDHKKVDKNINNRNAVIMKLKPVKEEKKKRTSPFQMRYG